MRSRVQPTALDGVVDRNPAKHGVPYVTTVEQAGIEKGLQQGEARTLLRQLTRKFGPEAAQRHRERIETAEVEQLDAWLDRILTADTPETIFH
jgi:hypothetical protein